MESIEHRDPELEESFSFSSSCYDFHSSVAAFSDNDESDDDSYIEIAIEPTTTSQNNDDGDHEHCDQEMELRISFSSTIPVQEPSPKTKTMDMDMDYELATPSTWASSSSASTIFTFRSSSTDTSQWDPQVESKPSTSRIQNTIKQKIRFPFINTLMPSLKVSSEMDRESGQAPDNNHLEVVPSRYSHVPFTFSILIPLLFLLRCKKMPVYWFDFPL